MSNLIAIKNNDGSVDLICKQATTWRMFLTVKDGNGNAINLVNYTFEGSIKTSYTATSGYLFEFLIIDAPGGKLSVSVKQTSAIPSYQTYIDAKKLKTYKGVGVYVYDINMIDENDEATRLLEGMLYVSPAVTK